MSICTNARAKDRFPIDDDPIDALCLDNAAPIPAREIVHDVIGVTVVAERLVVVDVKIRCKSFEKRASIV